jgi:hypothetical protein
MFFMLFIISNIVSHPTVLRFTLSRTIGVLLMNFEDIKVCDFSYYFFRFFPEIGALDRLVSLFTSIPLLSYSLANLIRFILLFVL